MLELAESVAKDLDGDDVISSAEDMYGLNGGNRDTPYYIFAGADMKFARIDDDGYMELTFDEDSVLLWQKTLDELLYTDFYYENAVDHSLIPENFKPFQADKSLFRTGLVKSVIDFRNMDSDYGVLPIPKYDEDQEEYASLVWMHHDCVLGIPGSCSNTEMISVVLEHMSYISYYDVYPIFYDTIILGKSARDEQSKQMLELVFRTRVFDPGQYWLNSSIGYFLTLHEQKVENISSFWAGLQGKAETAVDNFNDMLDNLES